MLLWSVGHSVGVLLSLPSFSQVQGWTGPGRQERDPGLGPLSQVPVVTQTTSTVRDLQ